MSEKGGGISPSAMCLLRILIGAYVIYADYSAIDDVAAMSGPKQIGLAALMTVIFIGAVALIIYSLRQLIAGRRDDRDK